MPPKRAKPKTYERARALRKELTPAERKLWSVLRGNKLNGVSFRRQHAIGNYIVDFVSIKKIPLVSETGKTKISASTYKYIYIKSYMMLVVIYNMSKQA